MNEKAASPKDNAFVDEAEVGVEPYVSSEDADAIVAVRGQYISDIAGNKEAVNKLLTSDTMRSRLTAIKEAIGRQSVDLWVEFSAGLHPRASPCPESTMCPPILRHIGLKQIHIS